MKLSLSLFLLGVYALSGCIPFNRDALWNAPIPMEEYCTYYQEDFPMGSLFVHRLDEWTEYRIRWGYELKVLKKIGNQVVLQHGWNVFNNGFDTYYDFPYTDFDRLYRKWQRIPTYMSLSPIVVIPLHPDNVQVGDFYREYGQYKYESKMLLWINGKSTWVKVFRQINTSQELVAEPYPFFYFRY